MFSDMLTELAEAMKALDGKKIVFRNPILVWATSDTCAVPPAELAIVSTRRVRA